MSAFKSQIIHTQHTKVRTKKKEEDRENTKIDELPVLCTYPVIYLPKGERGSVLRTAEGAVLHHIFLVFTQTNLTEVTEGEIEDLEVQNNLTSAKTHFSSEVTNSEIQIRGFYGCY